MWIKRPVVIASWNNFLALILITNFIRLLKSLVFVDANRWQRKASQFIGGQTQQNSIRYNDLCTPCELELLHAISVLVVFALGFKANPPRRTGLLGSQSDNAEPPSASLRLQLRASFPLSAPLVATPHSFVLWQSAVYIVPLSRRLALLIRPCDSSNINT